MTLTAEQPPAPPDRLTPDQIAEQMAKWEDMCWHIARCWCNKNTDLEIEEVAAWARFGMLQGAKRFDPSRGVAFSTYCCHYARRQATNFVRRQLARGMKLPSHLRGTIVRVPCSTLDAPAASCRTADATELYPEVTRRANVAPARPEASLAPDLPADFWTRLRADLTSQQNAAVVWYFRENLTYREIGERLGLSHERCRQIVRDALGLSHERCRQIVRDALGLLRQSPALIRIWEDSL